MKFIHHSNKPERKVVALLGISGLGTYTFSNGVVYYLSKSGDMCRNNCQDWAELCRSENRTKIYEGDSLTLEF